MHAFTCDNICKNMINKFNKIYIQFNELKYGIGKYELKIIR